MNMTTDIRQSFIKQTVEDDFINNEWEDILNGIEVDEQKNPEVNSKERQQKKEIVMAARKKYTLNMLNILGI
jgi:hypothetical protein